MNSGIYTEYILFKEPLTKDTTLILYNNDDIIFSSKGKWLNPLFELDLFLCGYKGGRNNFCVHDTAVGKAAAVLMVRMGIKHIYANLASKLAVNYVNEYNRIFKKNITFEYSLLVDRLLCATENQFENLFDSDEIYSLLRQRAKLVQGVTVCVNALCYKYGAIQNISFELNSGDKLMIIGENGVGKTTLLRLLAGIIKSDNGSILVDGEEINNLPKNTIGYISQFVDETQFSLSVEEVVGLGINSKEKDKKAVVRRTLERTSSLHLYGRSFNSLSGGEKQKVSLARCLAQNAKLLLMDEPTASLDAENKKMVIDILRSLSVTEIPTIIIVTHDTDLVSMTGWKQLRIGNAQ